MCARPEARARRIRSIPGSHLPGHSALPDLSHLPSPWAGGVWSFQERNTETPHTGACGMGIVTTER